MLRVAVVPRVLLNQGIDSCLGRIHRRFLGRRPKTLPVGAIHELPLPLVA